MAIRTPPTAETAGEYVPCPPGTFNAVLADVSEPYLHRGVTPQGVPFEKVCISLCWQVAKRMHGGRRFSVSQRYTLSQHPKSNLRPVLVTMLGRGFGPKEETQGVDVEALIGRPCMVEVTNSPDGKWANVKAVVPLVEGLEPIGPEDYTRWQDRERKPKWWPAEPVDAARAGWQAAGDPDDEFNAAAAGPDASVPF